jgi:predicted GNAT family acetyltransferase
MATENLDETLEESFPASDAPANTVITGVRVDAEHHERHVEDNTVMSRFEIFVRGRVAFLQYERRLQTISLVHTEVPPPLRGLGLANTLAKYALESAHDQALTVVVMCPFVRAYLRRYHN